MNQRSSVSFAVGSWGLSHIHRESVRIRDVETVRNHAVYQVWIPRLATVERVPAESLAPAQPTRATGLDLITCVVAAARIADALTQDVLLAPLEAGGIPLPHQLHALTRAVTGDRVGYLPAYEVGLGQTIEAGLIFRELKLQGLVKRVLVVAPKGFVAESTQGMQKYAAALSVAAHGCRRRSKKRLRPGSVLCQSSVTTGREAVGRLQRAVVRISGLPCDAVTERCRSC